MRKIKTLKTDNGFTTVDALIAILIIALFTGIIATIIYNIYLANTSIKRMSIATGYITSIFEYTEKIYYDDVTIENLKKHIQETESNFYTNNENNKIVIESNNNDEIKEEFGNPNAYTINIYIEYYNKTEGNTEKLDLIKQITVTVSYKLGNKNQSISMTKIKQREK